VTQKNAKKTAARARQQQLGGKYQSHLRVVGPEERDANAWVCSVCGKPIEDVDGYISVEHAERGGMPFGRAPGEEVIEEKPLGKLKVTRSRVKPHVKFGAFHRACRIESHGYDIEISRANTFAKWGRWVEHLCMKGWMAPIDVRRMLAFWRGNRGEDTKDLALF
jgi:hypothetical protein